MPESFRTARLGAFRLRHEDAEEIFYTYASKAEATRFVSWPTHQNLKETRSYLSRTWRGWDLGVDYSFGIRLDGRRLIGSCGVVNDDGVIQFGYIFSPNLWGQGFATEACRALLDLLRQMPEIKSIGTFVDADNIASIRVLEKSGLRCVERREKWFRFVNQDNTVKDCLMFSLPV